MYDGEGQPGRNDECWCGSGKKYKKCHWQTDERLQELYDKGYEVPTRDILKAPLTSRPSKQAQPSTWACSTW